MLPRVSRLAVDPLDPRVLFVRARGRVFRSPDAGASYQTVLDVGLEATLPLLAIAHVPGEPAQVSVGEQAGDAAPLRALRIGDGQSFRLRSTTPIGIGRVAGSGQSIVAGPRSGDLVLTTSGSTGALQGVYSYLPALDRLVPVDEFGLGPLLDVQRSGAGRPTYSFSGRGRMVQWVPGALSVAPPVVDLTEFATDRDVGVRPLSDATRVLGPASVRIGPGQTRTVPLTLELAPEPTPLDVFFLLDTSGSMEDVIKGLGDGFGQLAQDLSSQGIDARYGLGDYQDLNGLRYRRLVDISPADGPLRRALKAITTGGGDEPAYTALDQLATGSGIPAPRRGLPVAAGLGASWRPGSLRVVVHATDEVPSNDPDGADAAEAVSALRADGVRHVGIEVVRDAVRQVADSALVPAGELNDILKRLSRDTGALAPAGGIDCDGNGTVEIGAGQPIVCALQPGGNRVELAEPLRRVLSGLVDEQTVGVAVGPAASVTGLSARLRLTSATALVDVTKAQRVDFSFTATCPLALAGTSRELRLRPVVGRRQGRVDPLQVVCAALPAAAAGRPAPPVVQPDPVLALPPAGPVLVVLPIVPPVAPPAPISAPAPVAAPAAAPVPAAAPGVAALPAVAVAPGQQQVELALAGPDSEQLAMVDRRERPDLLALRLLALAALCAVATGVAGRQRTAREGLS